MSRKYVQRARAEAAGRTRAEILDAARGELLASPRLEFSTGAVAQRAGVARSTIYAAFGSRAGLLAALAENTLLRAGFAALITEYRREDAVVALERSLRASCLMFAAEHGVFARLIVLGSVDPDAAVPIARTQADRGRGMADLARRLADQRRLRPGLAPERAAHLLWVLTGFGTFDELYSGRQLDAEACADVLIEMARRSVLS